MVPLYQRTYSWEEDQWEQLWEDVLEIYAMEQPKNHFIGSVVTQQIPTSPEGVSRYTLIDGQQRMTTLFILLSVIRQRAESEPRVWGRLATEIERTCLINEFNDGDQRIKLMPTQLDRESFSSTIRGLSACADSRVGEAHLYFSRMLDGRDFENAALDLRKLHSCVVNHLDLVSIHLEDHDSPNRIFESLNNTGMPLTVADLIRNYLLMSIHDLNEQDKAYHDYWFPMEQLFAHSSQEHVKNFFWHYLMMDGSLPRMDDTYEKFQESISPTKSRVSAPSPVDAIQALKRVSTFSHYYCQIAELGENDRTSAIGSQISRLNQWEVAVAYPFLLRGMDLVNSQILAENDLIAVMEMIESFVIRRTVCGVPTNQLRRIFAQMAAQVDFGELKESARAHLLKNNWPADDDFKHEFIRFPFYSRGRGQRTNLVLWSLEQSFGHKETPVHSSEITIEHIMPQTLTSDWRELLGANGDEVHARLLHTIGNLTLSGYNTTLSNKPFIDKKEALAESNFALNQSVSSIDIWDEQAILDRASGLAELALEIWRR